MSNVLHCVLTASIILLFFMHMGILDADILYIAIKGLYNRSQTDVNLSVSLPSPT